MQGPPGGGGWNPGGGPPGGGWGQPPGSSPGTPQQQQPSAPGQQPPAPGAPPARTVALSQAELMSVHGPGSAPGVPAAAPPPGAYPGAMPAQPVAMAQAAPTNVGVGIGVAWLLLGLLSCVATGAAAALLGESQSVMVSYLTVPMIFAGFVAPVAGAIARKQSTPVAIGAPVGCGCATMLFALVAVIVFYEAIWPSL